MTNPGGASGGREWPPFSWTLVAFLGGLFLMLNHFYDQGIRYGESERLFRFLAIRVSPILLMTAGLLAMVHARAVQPGIRVVRLLVSIVVWCVLAFIPLVMLESELFPVGHGISEGVMIGVRHTPFVAVCLAGLWAVGRVYRRNRRALLAIASPIPAGFLSGSALVYVILIMKRLSFHWYRCREVEGTMQFLKCFF